MALLKSKPTRRPNGTEMAKKLIVKFNRGSVCEGKKRKANIVDIRMKIAAMVQDKQGLEAMEGLFDQMDTNRDGTLCLTELSNGFAQYGIGLDQEEVELLFKYLDTDHSGDIDLDEVHFCSRPLHMTQIVPPPNSLFLPVLQKSLHHPPHPLPILTSFMICKRIASSFILFKSTYAAEAQHWRLCNAVVL
jgi:hypothetical protein